MVGVGMSLFVIQPLLIAIWSQKSMNRVGIIWFLVALALDIAIAMFTEHAVTSDPKYVFDSQYRDSLNTPGHAFASFLIPVIISTFITMIIIATLPKNRDR